MTTKKQWVVRSIIVITVATIGYFTWISTEPMTVLSAGVTGFLGSQLAMGITEAKLADD
jgi:hypothetical protein